MKYTWWLGLAGAVVVIAGGLLIFFNQRQQGNLAAALGNLAHVQTMHAKAELRLYLPPTLRGQARPFTNVKLRIEGDLKRAPGAPWELTGTLYGDARGQGNIFFTNGDIRLLSDAVAFRLENLPVLVNPSQRLVKRWTYVDTPVLATQNAAAVTETFTGFINHLHYQDQQEIEGVRLAHYTGRISEEDKKQLITVWHKAASGNQALDVLARLLAANEVKDIDLWLKPQTQSIERLQAEFIRRTARNEEVRFALFQLTLSEPGKTVTIERPPRQAHVNPGVFAKLFGQGEIPGVE